MNHYALSKAAMELLVKKCFDRYPIVIVRPFNYTGPGQSAGFLFAKIVAAFHRRDPKLKLGNLDVSRDLSDISFVVEAYKRLLLLPLSSEIFNICSGSGISIAQTIRIMQEMTGYSPEIIVDQALIRKDEIRELTGDPAKLLSAIGSLEPVPQPVIFANMIAALASGQ